MHDLQLVGMIGEVSFWVFVCCPVLPQLRALV